MKKNIRQILEEMKKDSSDKRLTKQINENTCLEEILEVVINNQRKGECSLFDDISYREAIGRSVVSDLEFIKYFVFSEIRHCGYNSDEISSILNAIIKDCSFDTARIFFMELLFLYYKAQSESYRQLKKAVKKLLM